MKKKYITYSQYGKVKKAVLDENLFRQYRKDPTIDEIIEYDTEMLMEKKYAERIGVGNNSRQTLFD